jgi:hypothetical protein
MSVLLPKTANLHAEFYKKQRAAFDSQGTDMLFGGASEGGKSAMVRIADSVWSTVIPNLQSLICRKFYGDVVENHMTGELNFHVILADLKKFGCVKIREDEVEWLETGSLIRLRQLRTDEDLEKAQGIAKHLLVLEEAPQMKERHIRDVRGWVRMSNDMKKELPKYLRNLYPWMSDEELMEMFPRIINTGNPIGTSVGYFRREYVECREPGDIEKVGAWKRVFIPSLVTDNPSADPVAQRERLEGMSGKAIADALIYGLWNTPAGDFLKEFHYEKHVVEDIGVPPRGWFAWRAFDWGSGAPACVLWFTVSSGEEFTDAYGNTRWYQKGTIIVYREWYIANPDDPSKGLNLTNESIANGILALEHETTSNLTLTDSFPFQDHGHSKMGTKYTIADEFLDAKVPLTLGNTRRKFGWGQVKKRLKGNDRGPLLVICKSCKYLIDYVGALETDPEDIEDAVQDGEATHATDTLRIGVAVRPTPKEVETEKESLPTYKPPDRLSATPEQILKLRRAQKRNGRR